MTIPPISSPLRHVSMYVRSAFAHPSAHRIVKDLRVTCHTTWPPILTHSPPLHILFLSSLFLPCFHIFTFTELTMSSGDWFFPSSSTSSSDQAKRCDVDRDMVEIELDAARVLADFAHIALLERESSSGGGIGERRRSTRKRGRNYNNDDDNNNNNNNIASSPFTSSSDDKTPVTGGGKVKVEEDTVIKEKKEEEGLQSKRRTTAELSELRRLPLSVDLNQRALPEEEEMSPDSKHDQKKTPDCSSSRLASFSVGRGKSELTESEKEAKKLRRVLANRESARQTIRRRQALCENLMRKAAGLSRENDEMKKEKESVFKEYLRLNEVNKDLKQKMMVRIKEEEASTRLELETPSSSMFR
ncbi:hypothetical protein ZOSMA_166G00500 [Zostera marina]|uniref:BZIP domain-containing protein n=1 Tax=Zostera marina TaxID=29655 RepID=A0A0K9PVS2_ZOSMR|nr:hypothetical protein ZOSMA_166G00500 [Zostera marina]